MRQSGTGNWSCKLLPVYRCGAFIFSGEQVLGRDRTLKCRDRGQVESAEIAITDGENRRFALAYTALKAVSDANLAQDGEVGHFVANGEGQNDHTGNPRRAFLILRRIILCRESMLKDGCSNKFSALTRYPPRYLTHPTTLATHDRPKYRPVLRWIPCKLRGIWLLRIA